MRLSGKNIVLGVTGSIAAYKAAELASSLVKEGANLRVVMTNSACNFINPETFRALSKNKVLVDTFDVFDYSKVEHIDIAQNADLLVIAPVTANTLAKFAHGIADNMLSDIFIAAKCPILLAPAMNTNMWNNVATVSNAQCLINRGVSFIGPCDGNLACGTQGNGKMVEPAVILEKIVDLLKKNEDFKLNILITAGPTIEPIDPVRYIGNRSSGKMGYAIASVAKARGANVCLITGPVNISPPSGIKIINVETCDQMYDAVLENAKEFDVIIQSAAPADYKVMNYSDKKIKKNNNEIINISFLENPDIAASLGLHKRQNQTLVGFAAETNNCIENANKKLIKKNLDLIIMNDVTKAGAGFGSDTNIATLITRNDSTDLGIMSKYNLAEIIIDKIIEIRNK